MKKITVSPVVHGFCVDVLAVPLIRSRKTGMRVAVLVQSSALCCPYRLLFRRRRTAMYFCNAECNSYAQMAFAVGHHFVAAVNRYTVRIFERIICNSNN